MANRGHRRIFNIVLCVSPAMIAVTLLTVSMASSVQLVKTEPLTTLRWDARGTGYFEWGSTNKHLFATSGKPSMVDIWEWVGSQLKLVGSLETGTSIGLAVGDDGGCYVKRVGDPFISRIENADGARAQWAVPMGWAYERLGISANGRFLVVGLVDKTSSPPPGHDWHRPRLHVGVIEPSSGHVTWAATLRGNYAGATSALGRMVPSDQGDHVAVPGWNANAVAMIDVKTGASIWERGPEGEVNTSEVAFSPDGKTLFTAGTQAAVFAMDVQTGKDLSCWYASASGGAEYGHRASCLAVSPDGNMVACGTGPAGLAWVFRTSDGKQLAALDHGGSTLLLVSFSPDSRYLATFGSGSIKIWPVVSWLEQAKAP